MMLKVCLINLQTEEERDFTLTVLLLLLSVLDGREGKDSASTTEELELELEALDITDEPLELEGPDEAENEELAKKLLDEQGKHDPLSEDRVLVCCYDEGKVMDGNPL